MPALLPIGTHTEREVLTVCNLPEASLRDAEVAPP